LECGRRRDPPVDSSIPQASQGFTLLQPSEGLESWFAEQQLSLALTTYRANRLLFLGRAEAGGLRLHERLFDRPMGLFAEGESLWMAARQQLWRLDNHLAEGLLHEGGDRLYVPCTCTTTGDVNAHELVVPSVGPWAGEPLFINTAFSCLARLRRGFSFEPVWQPPFLKRLAADDACHLNGIALQDGEPTWATACGHSPAPSSWRHHRGDGGVVMHLPSDSIVATGLSMPHSPRWHDGRLWLLNSGSGELGWIQDGRFHSLCPLPGFARGLAFQSGCAVVGLSKLRSPQLSGLALDERLLSEGRPMGCCGLRVIDLASGAVLHGLDLAEPIDELFDVVSLPGVRQPRALGLQGEEIECLVRLPQRAEQVRVRPLAPSGNPYRGPELAVFGLPEPSPKILEPAGAAATMPPQQAKRHIEGTTPAADIPIFYQRVFHLTPANLAPYTSLTFPTLAPGSAALQRIEGELLGLSAMAEGRLVGLAIAERLADGCAQLLSFKVEPLWRGRGIGTGLLARLMVFLARDGITALKVRYRETTLSHAAFEPMLARLGWRAPQTDFLLLEGRSHQLAAIGWGERHPIRDPYRILPWGELPAEQRQRAAPLEGAPELRPSATEPDPELSLTLLHHDAPVGLLLVHRTSAEALRYFSLDVAPAHRGRARGLALLHEGFRRQHAAAIPTARAAIDYRNGAMRRLLRRHLAQHLLAIGRSRTSQVCLPPPRAAPARAWPDRAEQGPSPPEG
jgi:uncharacterized protein (TIGR03032 family)